ncbi:MAG: TDT family transporter [Negativicutes bacterium]|nr:TDT family transporter [Negativicutes bacterium]
MKDFFKKIPMPIVGVSLALAALGNLVQSYGDNYRNLLGSLAGILLLLSTAKFISDFSGLMQELNTPIGASVFPTYSMSLMLLAAYLKPYHAGVAALLWLIGLGLHLVLLIRFTLKFVVKFEIKQVFPSWFIVYVGIAVAAVTGKAFNQTVGQAAFWFALASYLVLLFVVSKRAFWVKGIPEPALPTLAIFAAPGALCLAGYLNCFNQKNMLLFYALLVLSQAFYFFVLSKMLCLLRLKFYPSYSAFTFPLVIAALSLKLSQGFLLKQGIKLAFLPTLVKAEELIALVVVFYVLIRYLAKIAHPQVI